MSSNNPDLLDVGTVMDAFETLNGVTLELRGRVESVRGVRELTLSLTAHDARWEIAEHAPLASVKCHPQSGDHITMDAAIMWALYQLDSELARLEFRKKENAS